MKIDHDEVRRIARLANLEFEDCDLPRLEAELSRILTYMERLARLDTSRVEPTFHSLEQICPLREDVPSALLRVEGDAGNAGPAAGPYIVPKVIG